MLNIRKVIVVIDTSSESQPGLQKVLQLAREIDFELKLIA